MRLPVEVLVVVCLLVGILPALTIGPYLRTAAVSVLGTRPARLQPRESGTGSTSPLVMSLSRSSAASRSTRCCRGAISARAGGAAAHPRAARASASSSACSSPSPGSGRGGLFRLLGTERLQSQLRILVLVALRRGRVDALGRRPPASRRRRRASTRSSRMLWAVGGACAVAAAWQAKYHRFAALVLVGGAGVVTCLTFVWLSAPDLAVTQLLVEVVTTVLLLLGLRWLPKRLRGDRRRPDRSSARARRGARPRHRRRLRPRHRRHRLCGDDLAARPRRRRLVPRATPTSRAAAPTSSTSSSSTSAASTPSARSPCSASSRSASSRCCAASARRRRAVGLPEQQRIQDALDDEREDRSLGDTRARLPGGARR